MSPVDAPAPVPPDSGGAASGDRADLGRTGQGAEEPPTAPSPQQGSGVDEAGLGGGVGDLGGGGDLGGDPVRRDEDAEPDETRP